jgi:hypothetical protein
VRTAQLLHLTCRDWGTYEALCHPHEPLARWLVLRFGIPSHSYCTELQHRHGITPMQLHPQNLSAMQHKSNHHPAQLMPPTAPGAQHNTPGHSMPPGPACRLLMATRQDICTVLEDVPRGRSVTGQRAYVDDASHLVKPAFTPRHSICTALRDVARVCSITSLDAHMLLTEAIQSGALSTPGHPLSSAAQALAMCQR